MYAFNSAAIFLPGHPYIESTTVLSDARRGRWVEHIYMRVTLRGLKHKPQVDTTPETLQPTRLTDALAVLKVLFIVLLLTRGQSSHSQLQFKGGTAAIAVASSSTVRGGIAVVVVLRLWTWT